MADLPTPRDAIVAAIGSMWETTWHLEEDGVERPTISAKRPEDIADAVLAWLRETPLPVILDALGILYRKGLVPSTWRDGHYVYVGDERTWPDDHHALLAVVDNPATSGAKTVRRYIDDLEYLGNDPATDEEGS